MSSRLSTRTKGPDFTAIGPKAGKYTGARPNRRKTPTKRPLKGTQRAQIGEDAYHP